MLLLLSKLPWSSDTPEFHRNALVIIIAFLLEMTIMLYGILMFLVYVLWGTLGYLEMLKIHVYHFISFSRFIACLMCYNVTYTESDYVTVRSLTYTCLPCLACSIFVLRSDYRSNIPRPKCWVPCSCYLTFGVIFLEVLWKKAEVH